MGVGQVVDALLLTEDQVDIILQVRREQLRKLKGIYSERLALHTRGADALLPGGSGDGLAAQLQHLHFNGFLHTMRDIIRVSSALDALKVRPTPPPPLCLCTLCGASPGSAA